MKVKVLSLTQPWATLVALNLKRIETRSWRTAYVGPLYIHAAKGFPGWAKETCSEHPFADAFCEAFGCDFDVDMLPLGQIIARTDLLGCMKTEDILGGKLNLLKLDIPWTHREFAFGDYGENRWGLLLAKTSQLARPIPARGALGLWDYELTEAA